MSTPAFDPQPCCDGATGALDVNVLGTVSVAEPLDVNVLGTVPVSGTVGVSGTVSVAEPVDVNVLGTVPVSGTVGVSGTVSVAEPLDVNVLGTVPVSGTVGVSGTISATVSGSTTAQPTLTGATVVAAGTTVDFGNAKSNVSLLVEPSGSVNGGIVRLEASQGGPWVKIGETALLSTGENQYVSLSGGAFRLFRGTVTEAISGGGSVNATLMYA